MNDTAKIVYTLSNMLLVSILLNLLLLLLLLLFFASCLPAVGVRRFG